MRTPPGRRPAGVGFFYVRASAGVFEGLGADVETRFYDGLGHAITTDELVRIDELVGAVAGGSG
ncbi:hypothetical protein [Halomarina oriensis]|uniref:Phospholipase/carboxylesterase/thioesterase domain-containing protein n=1 Tax=Halomarina oriensis TaxID=671145 RepID=A0A6B0GNX9_9EURY|nr:hypothetical protein [Halomarina oriensis]MWG36636.1 hypothetical protein [Halomarina oriensis]